MNQKTKYFFQLALITLLLIIYIYDARAVRSDIEKFETAISDIDLQLEAGAEVVNDMNKIRQDFIKNKKQAIFISIHQSNWEVLVPGLDRIGINIGGIYRHINNNFIDKLILNIRQNSLVSKNSFYTPKGKKSAKDVVDAINNSLSIVLLIDQKDSSGEEVMFFNKKVKTQTGFLKIARKYNLPIIPIQNKRIDNGNIELTFLEPLYHNNLEINDTQMMEEIHNKIEQWIKAEPSQWFWQHKRFS